MAQTPPCNKDNLLIADSSTTYSETNHNAQDQLIYDYDDMDIDKEAITQVATHSSSTDSASSEPTHEHKGRRKRRQHVIKGKQSRSSNYLDHKQIIHMANEPLTSQQHLHEQSNSYPSDTKDQTDRIEKECWEALHNSYHSQLSVEEVNKLTFI